MCHNCGKMVSALNGTSLQSLFERAQSYGGSMTAAALGCYREILSILQTSGGCSSCMMMIEGEIRRTF